MAQQSTLTTDEALVLQQINEHGEDDVIGLEQSLRMSRPKLMAQLTHLKNKGLITVKMTTGDWQCGGLSPRGAHPAADPRQHARPDSVR